MTNLELSTECWKLTALHVKATHLVNYAHKCGVCAAVVAEWLRRWTRNPLGSARTGSNPVDCEVIFPFKLSFFF